MMANPDCLLSREEISNALGISTRTLYRWLLRPDFNAELERLSREYTRAEFAGVRKALIAACRSGDARAIKLFLELNGGTALPEQSLGGEDRELLLQALSLLDREA